MKRLPLLTRILIWRKRNVSDGKFIILLSGIVGIIAGLGAVIIKNLVHFIQTFLTRGFTIDVYQIMFFIYPALGILVTALFAMFIIKRKVGHGIPNVLY